MSKISYKNYLSIHPEMRDKIPMGWKIKWIHYNFDHIYKNISKQGNILDIGPGLGETLIAWKEMGFKNIKSIDISSEVVSHINKIGFHCQQIKNCIEYLDNNRNTFDCINLSDILEHVPQDNLYSLLLSVYKSLKNNGTVVIKSPNAQSPFFNVGFYADPTHILGFTEHSLSQLFNYGGFKNIISMQKKNQSMDLTLKG